MTLILVVKRESLESYNLSILVCCSKNSLYALLVVRHSVLLLEKGLLLEELLETSLSDILNHLHRKVCCLLLANSLDYLTSLVSLLRSEPAL